MPTYEYRCRECGRRFDVFQRMSDAPVAACAECGGNAERLMSGGAGLLFKGEGFYITDYRSDAYKKKAEKDSGGEDGKAAGQDKGGGAKKKGAKTDSEGSAGGAGGTGKPARSGKAADASSAAGRKAERGE